MTHFDQLCQKLDTETDTFWHASFENAVLNFTVYEDFPWEADRTRIDYKLVR